MLSTATTDMDAGATAAASTVAAPSATATGLTAASTALVLSTTAVTLFVGMRKIDRDRRRGHRKRQHTRRQNGSDPEHRTKLPRHR
jgi:hypothetical protein